ncbi:hypothetical protein IW152_005140 [Coemansia sp. BCRC 34962]|nr:hypothetical protein IW152_005140 [Coemansia sp. BCRC 34962]
MDVVEALYRQTYGYSLIPSGMAPVDFYRKLAKVAKGNAWVPWLHGSNTNKQTGLQFLRRDDSHPESSCFNLLKRIGLTKDSSRVVLGPRLCCVLVIIGGMSADVMTGDLLGKIFLTVAGMHLNSLHVATAGGIANLSNHEVCELTKDWLLSVAAFVATEDNVAFTLESARVCNEEYLDKCTSDAGQNDAIALEMLENAEHCACLFLGISKRDLKVLCRYLPFLISKNTDPLVKDALRRVSDEMFGDIEIE